MRCKNLWEVVNFPRVSDFDIIEGNSKFKKLLKLAYWDFKHSHFLDAERSEVRRLTYFNSALLSLGGPELSGVH